MTSISYDTLNNILIPYYTFNNIITYSDMKTLICLYNTNSVIRNLCNKSRFMKVLLEFNKNIYFNPNIKSTTLNDFLNDLSGNDPNYLLLIQNTFGACLYGKNIKNHIILLEGKCNGKSTFLLLLRKLFGHMYSQTHLNNNSDWRHVLFLEVIHCSIFEHSGYIKALSGGDDVYYKGIIISPKFTPILNDFYVDNNLHQSLERRLMRIKFQTKFRRDKPINQEIVNFLLNDNNTMSALLTFLLQGCKNVIG